MKFSTIILICFILIACPLLLHDAYAEESAGEEMIRARIIKLVDETTEELGMDTNMVLIRQKYEVLIREGEHKGERVIIENVIDPMYAYNLEVSPRDDVFIILEENENGQVVNGYIAEIVRDKYIIYAGILFCIILILISKLKGLKAIITLILTGFAIIKIFIPKILEGYSPVIMSIIICIFVTFFTFLIIGGLNRKTLSAIIGTIGGVLVAGIVSVLFSRLANLTGLGFEEAQMLLNIPQEVEIDFKGLLFAGIIIGALGAVMDVSMSISSAMFEIVENNPAIEGKQLIKSGMNVGKDIMGTMANTLILAYISTSIPLFLLYFAHNLDPVKIINLDVIASEIIRSFAGSIGLFVTVPITAFVCSKFRIKIK